MPDQVGWFFHGLGRIWVQPHGIVVGLFLSREAAGGKKRVPREAAERQMIVRFGNAIDRAGEFTLP
jgi:hypothetical protein